jgi:UDP:flavonoid glycosyltransferase YjiC (YdhE family)
MRRSARVLLVAPPGNGHVFPIVPFAWALRAAGHEVLVATCGVSLHACTHAGLAVVNVGVGLDVAALQNRHAAAFAHAFPPVDGGEAARLPLFDDLCDATAAATLAAAREWRADLVVYTAEASAGLVAATAMSVPAVFVSVGLVHSPSMMAGVQTRTAATAASLGCSRLDQPAAWIDLTPPSLRTGGAEGWPMRYVPYSGGYTRSPDAEPSPRRRIAVTLGTIVPFVFGLAPLVAVIDAARHVDAEFVVAHGAAHGRVLGPLPDNVRALSWTPLDELLATCQAVVHHGGFGTAMTALAAGLPQLIVPMGSDNFANARLLAGRGAAIVCDGRNVTPADLDRLHCDDRLRDEARTLRGEIARMPPPADVAPRVAALAL